MKFNPKLLALIVFIPLYIGCTNSNSASETDGATPTADAQQVCDCFIKIKKQDLNYTQASEASKKCSDLATKKTLKYAEKQKELMEYNLHLNNCLNSSK